MKRVALILLAFVVVLSGVVILRTVLYKPDASKIFETVEISVDGDRIAQNLSQAIRFKTISHQDPAQFEPLAFEGFATWLEAAYPEVHANLTRERIADYTLLFKWQGRDTGSKPILLTGHYDVVPVIPGTEEQWTHDPFAGDIVDGLIWGRGALDDKSAVIAMLEAATVLLAEGFTPERTIYLSFGHDEEIGGNKGAAGVADHLKAQGVQLAWSLDEGSFVLDDMFPGVTTPIASINVAEKGYVTLELVAHGAGGHSSMPPKKTAVGILAKAIDDLQNSPFPGGMSGGSEGLFEAAGPHLPFSQRIVFANRWLLGGMLEDILAASPTTDAMMRTTIAPTMLSGSIKENVLPITATAVVNFRLHPRDNVDDVIAHVKRAIDNDSIDINVITANEASPVSSDTSDGFVSIANSTTAIYGNVIVASGLTIAGTDSKHYNTVADDAYRYNPMIVGPSELNGFHGTNEKISVENMVHATQFYVHLMKGE